MFGEDSASEYKKLIEAFGDEKYSLFLDGVRKGSRSIHEIDIHKDKFMKENFLASSLNFIGNNISCDPINQPKEFGDGLGMLFSLIKHKDFELVFDNSHLRALFLQCMRVLKGVKHFDLNWIKIRLEHVKYHSFQEEAKQNFIETLHML
jgi:hypothetical protein